MRNLMLTMAACALVSFAAQAEVQDVVKGGGGQVLKATNGTCVQTKWSAKDDVCSEAKPAPVAVAVPVPAPQPVMQLGREELAIYFEFNKSNITAESARKLTNIAEAVNRSPKVTRVNIVGYTDEIGTNSYNQKLSEKRAGSTKAYLDTKMRIPANVLEIRGLGESNPVTRGCDNIKKRSAKIACLAKDRRTEVEFEFEK